MNACFREKFLKNGFVFSCQFFNNQVREGICIYEVIRVIDGVCLFLEDHLERFKNSLRLMNVNFDISRVKADISSLLEFNGKPDGNIRCELFIQPHTMDLFSYYVEHHYPSNVDYINGVSVKSLIAERQNPNAKLVHENVKLKVNNLLKDKNIYEVALVNNSGFITEGSKSNLFFIKDDKLFTAPENLILSGITRKYIINAIRKLKFELVEEAVKLDEVDNCSAAFISGTSPKVLPICKFDDIEFNAQHTYTLSILEEFNSVIDQYILNMKTT